MQRKGWFIIPGVQDGDRTLDEQMTGVWPALAEAAGKRVLDLGCAEGLIGREFAKAGALSVHGIESVRGHLEVARGQCAEYPQMSFELADLNVLAMEQLRLGVQPRYDIVVALGVAHKMKFPGECVQFAARSTVSLMLVRFSARPESADGIMRSKHFRREENSCHVPTLMQQAGFELEKTLPGPREETVQYWRRA